MVEEKLKKLIIERYGSMMAFSKSIGMANSTLATIIERGVNKASVNNIIKICTSLEISADGLAHGKIINIKKNSIQKSIMNIEDIIEDTQKLICGNENIAINGEKMTDMERDTLAAAMGLSLEIIKIQNKKQNEKDVLK